MKTLDKLRESMFQKKAVGQDQTKVERYQTMSQPEVLKHLKSNLEFYQRQDLERLNEADKNKAREKINQDIELLKQFPNVLEEEPELEQEYKDLIARLDQKLN